jgi:putative FmdB family regulatory protein
MPLYEYACKACGQHLEVSQSFKDEPLTVCPACGGPLRKVFSPPAITFKGSGFYRTDNRSSRSEPKSSTSSASSKAAKQTA